MAVALCAVPKAGAQSPTEREIVHAGRATIAVTIVGKGEPVVFIPSRGRSVTDFADLSTRLVQAGYRVILPEPRGIGGSTGALEEITYHELASDIVATIDSLVGHPVTVIGHDFGGRIARRLAADQPALVARLSLLSAGGMIPRSPDVERLTTRFWQTSLSRTDRVAAVRQIFFAAGNNVPLSWQQGWHFAVARAQRASDSKTPLKEWCWWARRPCWWCSELRMLSPSRECQTARRGISQPCDRC